jgi:hypothetical protein
MIDGLSIPCSLLIHSEAAQYIAGSARLPGDCYNARVAGKAWRLSSTARLAGIFLCNKPLARSTKKAI